MTDRTEWEVYHRAEHRTGTYYTLNVIGSRGQRAEVKARALPGQPYVCLTCRANDCAHIAFVRGIDTADARDAGSAVEVAS